MSTVDNRVVHMTFDNAKFERDIAKTMQSIAELKKALDFSSIKKNLSDLGDLGKFKMNINTTEFNAKVADAIGNAKKLQDQLSFGTSTRGLSDLQEHVKKFSMENMSSAIAGIGGKFSALSVIGVTALATIVSKAVTAGFNVAKAFSVAPIIGGFQEMETNMNSIQTILANTSSKGTTLDDVNKALQQLNEYSDKTIYNFGQMARNIGTFTAAGVDLDTSVGAIKGIANLAAISGSNAEQASTAMYQLSQAIATGTVKLIDWNSVTNAGLGGEVFKNALFETGKALHKLGDIPMDTTFEEWEKNGVKFRDSLESGWLTADVLTTTLQSFTGDLTQAQLMALGYTEDQAKEMEKLGKLGTAAATEVKTLTQLLGTVKEAVGTGWADSFKIIFGDFNEAKTLFTGLNDAIGKIISKSADSRNKLLQGWKDLGGRTKLIEALKNAFTGLGEILNAVKSAFHFVFPPVTAERLFELTEKFAEFTDKLRLGQDGLDRVKRYAGAFFTAIDIGLAILRRFGEMVLDVFHHFTGGGEGEKAMNFFDRLARVIQHLYLELIAGGGLERFFDNMTDKLISFGEALKHPLDTLKDLKDRFLGFFDNIDFGSLDGLTEAFQRVKDKVGEVIDSLGFGNLDIHVPDKIKEIFDGITGKVDDNTTNSLAGGFDRVSTALDKTWDAFQKVKDIASNVFDALKKVDDVLGWIWDKLMSLKDIAFTVLDGMWDIAKNIGGALSEGLKSEELQSVLDILDTIAVLMTGRGIQQLGGKGLGINLAADLTGGNLPKVANAFDQMGGVFGSMRRNLDELSSTLQTMQTQIKANALLDVAKALALLTASVLVLSFINPESLAKSLTALAVGMGQLLGAVALLNASSGKAGLGVKGSVQLAGISGSMILISGAMVVLAGALTILARLKPDELSRGLLTLETLIIEMATAAKLLEGSTVSLIAAGAGMILIAFALDLMAPALLVFATMSWEDIGKGLTVVAGALLAIAGAAQLMPATLPLLGAGLVGVAFALDLMSGALLVFATMSWEDIGKGMTVLAGALLIIAGAMQLMPVTSVLSGPALIAVATALAILAPILLVFATMSWEEIGKSMTVLGGALLTLAVGLAAMALGIPGAIALGIAAVSLGAFMVVLKSMSKLSFKDLGKGLAVMAISLGALAIASVALLPAIPAMLALSVALIALGAGFALIGIGAALLAEAFKVIASAGKAGVDVLIYAIDLLIQRLPDMVVVFIDSIAMIVQSLLDALPAMITATGKIIQALLKVIIDAIPDIGIAVGKLIIAFLKVLRDSSPDFVRTMFKLLMDMLHGLEDNVTEITRTVAVIIERFLRELNSHIPELAAAGAALLASILNGIADHIGEIITAGVNVLESFLTGLAENVDDIADDVGILIQAIIDAVADLYGDIAQAGTDAFLEFLDGMADNASEILRHAARLIGDVIDALVTSAIILANRMADALIALLDGLTEAIETHDEEIADSAHALMFAIVTAMVKAVGADDIVKAMGNAGKALWEGVKNGFKKAAKILSPSKEMYDLALFIPAGLVKGLNEDTTSETASADLAKRSIQAFHNAMRTVAMNVESMEEFNPTITPVLDLTSVKATAGQIGGLLGSTPIQATASVQTAGLLSAETEQTRSEAAAAQEQTSTVKEVKFEQNNYSPESLSTAKIYKQTRNLIDLTKKELEVV